MSSLKKSKYGDNGEEGDRVFSVEEIPLFLTKIRQHLSVKYQHILLLQLSCATRVGETCLAKIEHFDLNTRTWFIPAENNKSKRDFTVYLSDFALGVAKSAIAIRSTSTGFLFPGINPQSQISPKSIAKTIRDKQMGGLPRSNRPSDTTSLLLPGGQWTSHDVRRTAATIMRSADAPAEIVEACLNHAETNRMIRVYHRHQTDEKMRSAWALLSNRLFKLEAIVFQETTR